MSKKNFYAGSFSFLGGWPLKGDANPNENVRAAVAKLQSMQLYHGGLSYWQGGTYENLWGTVYATHFLMEAKKAGFDVSQTVLNKIYKHLRQEVKKKRTRDYYYYKISFRYLIHNFVNQIYSLIIEILL